MTLVILYSPASAVPSLLTDKTPVLELLAVVALIVLGVINPAIEDWNDEIWLEILP